MHVAGQQHLPDRAPGVALALPVVEQRPGPVGRLAELLVEQTGGRGEQLAAFGQVDRTRTGDDPGRLGIGVGEELGQPADDHGQTPARFVAGRLEPGTQLVHGGDRRTGAGLVDQHDLGDHRPLGDRDRGRPGWSGAGSPPSSPSCTSASRSMTTALSSCSAWLRSSGGTATATTPVLEGAVHPGHPLEGGEAEGPGRPGRRHQERHPAEPQRGGVDVLGDQHHLGSPGQGLRRRRRGPRRAGRAGRPCSRAGSRSPTPG